MPSKMDRKCLNFATCARLIARESKTGYCQPCFQAERRARVPSERVKVDRQQAEAKTHYVELQRKYKAATDEIGRLEKALKISNVLDQGIDTYAIPPMADGKGTNEGTVIVVASDWHVGSRVKPGNVSGLNKYDLEIAKGRSTKFFQSSLRLTRLLQQDLTINNMVLGLLGDFITGHIHEEFVENNSMPPMQEVVEAQNMIASGIEFLLANSTLNLTIPCHSGNHARTTKKTWWSGENGHSLEYLMYLNLAAYFRTETERVKFIIPDGYHSYLDVYGRTVRFHHGHAINYQGGIGGIFIPAFKSISQWNKARKSDLDVFGHFHQAKLGGNFVSNGSLIGYDSYALSIKADFERPQQMLILMDKKRGLTCTWPVFAE